MSPGARFLVHGFFLLSGAAALAYEVLWTRQLTLVTGATTPAVGTVLSVFMGGLALGAWALGRVADRSRNLLAWYGCLEIAIGLFALLQPLLMRLAQGPFLLAASAGLGGTALLGLRLLFAAPLLLLPAALMGGTLPLLVKHVSRAGGEFGRRLGTLYAANLAGAVLGSGLTGFLLIRWLGVQGSLACAVGANLLVGLGALLWGLSRRDRGAAGEIPEPVPEGERVSPGLEKVLWAVLAASGFLTMAYEVVWTRILVFSFGSTVQAFTLILVAFLLGLALGSLAAARLAGPGPRVLAVAQGLAAIAALALAPLAASIPVWMEGAAFKWGPSPGTLLAISALGAGAVMLLPVTFMGLVFPLASRLVVQGHADQGRRLGRAYWINTVGSVAGSLLGGFLLIPLFSLRGALLALSLLQAGMALVLLPWWGEERRRGLLAGGGALLLALSAWALLRLPGGAAAFDRLDMERDAAGSVVEASRDDVNATVTVVRTRDGARTLRINGFVASGTNAMASYMPMMSHLPLLLHGRAKRELVICFGTGATAGAALLHPGVQVDVVDINQTVLDFAPHFQDVNHRIFADPRARLILDDGRNFLLTTRERYDVITSEPMPPTHAGMASLYSREYYALARERLNEGGIMVQWLPFHLVSTEQAWAILRSMQEVFPETSLWLCSHTGLIVGRKGAPAALDGAALDRAMASGPLAADLTRLGVAAPETFAQTFALDPKGVADLCAAAAPVTDDRPTLEFDPPRNPWGPAKLGLAREGSEAILAVFARRGATPPPMKEVPAEVGMRITAKWRLRNAIQAGMFLMNAGGLKEAHGAFAGALEMAREAPDRALCLYHLATVAVAQGNRPAARDFIARCLAEAPDSASAKRLKDFIDRPR